MDAIDHDVLPLTLARVVHSARRQGWPVLTGSAVGLRGVDPDLEMDELP